MSQTSSSIPTAHPGPMIAAQIRERRHFLPEMQDRDRISARWQGADAYELYMGRWSREVSAAFLAWLDAPTEGRWLDVGCGTGALTSQILRSEAAAASEAWGIDPSPAFVERARSSIRGPRARFETGAAEALAFEPDKFDVAVSGLLLNFVPDPACAVREMARVVRPAGIVGSYVWDYLGEMQMLRHFWDAVLARIPHAAELEEVRHFAICKPEPLSALFNDAGLGHVEVEAIDVPTRFRDFDDYWSPFLAGRGAAPAYLMSLAESDRLAIKQSLQATLPRTTDGEIELIARAWAVRGRVGSSASKR